jgi:transcriptional regulator with XRE-family HTH domain
MRYRKNLIGPQVRKLRKQRNWTHHQLAVELALRCAFMSAKTLERIESQREYVEAVALSAFAVVFNIRVEDLYPPETITAEASEMRRVLEKCGVRNWAPLNDDRQRDN